MKLLWIPIAIILSMGFNIQALDSFPNIKIAYEKYGFTDQNQINYSVLELNASGMNLYEVVKENESKDADYIVKLDKDGKPIKVLDSDPEYMDKFFTALGEYGKLKKGDKVPEALTIGAINKSYKQIKNTVCMAFSYKKESKYSNLIGVFGSYSNFIESQYFQTGTITVIDSDYNYFRLLHTDKGIVFQEAHTLNPDLISGHKYIGLFKMMTWISDWAAYRNRDSEDKNNIGFIWMKIGSKETYVSGDKEEIKHPPECKNGVVCVSLKDLTWNTLSRLETRDNKTFSVFRTTNMLGVPKSFNNKSIKVTADDPVYYVNDKKSLFPVAPYFKDDDLFVPCLEMCDAINAEYHFRPMDETILIARFDKAIEK